MNAALDRKKITVPAIIEMKKRSEAPESRNNAQSGTMHSRYRNLILMAIFIALAVAVGQDPFPNLELVSATIFLSGMMLGAKRGLIVGVVAEFLFSSFNAYGPAAPPLLIAQMLSMMLAGVTGGLVQTLYKPRIPPAWLLALIGFALTFVYDLLTTLSTIVIVKTGVSGFLTVVVTGFYFFLVHQISNTAIFAFLLPVLLRRLRQLPILQAELPPAKTLPRHNLQPSMSLEVGSDS
jgi:uncharacterized membrane protein